MQRRSPCAQSASGTQVCSFLFTNTQSSHRCADRQAHDASTILPLACHGHGALAAGAKSATPIFIAEGELALDKDGRFTAFRLNWIAEMGAYLSLGSAGHIRYTTTWLTGVYQILARHALFRVPLTNTTPVGSYRDAGRPDIAYVVERFLDQAVSEIGMDKADLRRRNFVPPNAFPCKVRMR